MDDRLINLSYLVAAMLFIYGLKAMASPRTARKGNLVSAVGMLIAIIFTMASRGIVSWTWIIVGLIAGSAVGAYLALTVKMTAMPQMVAMFNGFGGLASALVALVELYRWKGATLPGWDLTTAMPLELVISIAATVLIGWVTFVGSMVAWAKLEERIPGQPIVFPHHVAANVGVLVLAVALGALMALWPEARWLAIPLSLVAMAAGVLLVIPIGGADMPVVICLLNSYSGLAASAAGFVLSNVGLIVSGALVGASGIILTQIMCRAMNRSLANVLFGGVGAVSAGAAGEKKSVKGYSAEDAAVVLENSQLVIIIPGYGMAVAQAQHAVKEMADLLAAKGATVKYAIHPVAGRMPGHMNVLLAEADVPYDQLVEMEQINPELERADVAFVLGANDVVNPAARTAKGSPIYGMPILDADKARTVMIVKRSLAPGFAGVDNPLFYLDKTMMLFGDGKQMVMGIVAALKGAPSD